MRADERRRALASEDKRRTPTADERRPPRPEPPHMGPPIVASLEALDAQGAGLRVEFVKLPDRYAHRVVVVSSAGDAPTLLQSVEGDERPQTLQPPQSASEPCGTPPPTLPAFAIPALQELSVEVLRDGRRAAFLVGRSGDCHWSLAIEAWPDAARPRLAFDAACRITGPPGIAHPPIGSSYCVALPRAESLLAAARRAGSRSAGSPTVGSRCDVTLSAGTLSVEGLSTPGVQGGVGLSHADLCQVDVASDGCCLALFPSAIAAGGRPATVRWRYQMSWS